MAKIKSDRQGGRMKINQSAVAVLCVISLSAFIAWCGGFNFDERNFGVGVWVFATMIVCGIAACSARGDA